MLDELVPPLRRGLGLPVVRHLLETVGPGWELLSWRGVIGVHLVVYQGRYIGWVERAQSDPDRWVAVFDSMVITNDRTGGPLWHRHGEHAARTIATVHRNLSTDHRNTTTT
ncbi:hypothetical protein ACIGXM_35650 [Kitasatospora sp. NPDC052896]|uniref:hypothetical protein n=1 Tax=Kitasatospora sp. NPDC052896 TaxID=3364061 RepID=UPI0037C76034